MHTAASTRLLRRKRPDLGGRAKKKEGEKKEREDTFLGVRETMVRLAADGRRISLSPWEGKSFLLLSLKAKRRRLPETPRPPKIRREKGEGKGDFARAAEEISRAFNSDRLTQKKKGRAAAFRKEGEKKEGCCSRNKPRKNSIARSTTTGGEEMTVAKASRKGEKEGKKRKLPDAVVEKAIKTHHRQGRRGERQEGGSSRRTSAPEEKGRRPKEVGEIRTPSARQTPASHGGGGGGSAHLGVQGEEKEEKKELLNFV